jgi:hypothetical protein
MGGLCKLIWWAVVGLFRPWISLEAENLVLRHQLNVLRRKSPARIAFSGVDRMVFAGFYALAPNVLDALKIVKPDTVASRRLSGLLALEIASSRRPTEDRGRYSPTHSRDEHRQSPLGRTAHPWRVAQAWY